MELGFKCNRLVLAWCSFPSCLSDFHEPQNHLEDSLSLRLLGRTSGGSDWVDGEWVSRICFSNKLPGDAKGAWRWVLCGNLRLSTAMPRPLCGPGPLERTFLRPLELCTHSRCLAGLLWWLLPSIQSAIGTCKTYLIGIKCFFFFFVKQSTSWTPVVLDNLSISQCLTERPGLASNTRGHEGMLVSGEEVGASSTDSGL